MRSLETNAFTEVGDHGCVRFIARAEGQVWFSARE